MLLRFAKQAKVFAMNMKEHSLEETPGKGGGG